MFSGIFARMASGLSPTGGGVYSLPEDPDPTNNPATGQPAISGTTTQGETLTASAGTIADDDGIAGVSYSWQWNRNGFNIIGATSITYVLTNDDVGALITVTATFTDDLGNHETRTSAGVTPVANVNNDATGVPSVGGQYEEGSLLSVGIGTIEDGDGLPLGGFPGGYLFQWQSDTAGNESFGDISGATSWGYILQAGDVGDNVRVRVMFTDQRGFIETLYSGYDIVGDATAPLITAFSMSGATNTTTALVSTFTTDDGGGSGVDSWIISLSSTPPADENDSRWVTVLPTQIDIAQWETQVTVYAWAMDVAHNISEVATSTSTASDTLDPTAPTSFALTYGQNPQTQVNYSSTGGSDAESDVLRIDIVDTVTDVLILENSGNSGTVSFRDPDEAINWRMKIYDNAGNSSYSNSQQHQTQAAGSILYFAEDFEVGDFALWNPFGTGGLSIASSGYSTTAPLTVQSAYKGMINGTNNEAGEYINFDTDLGIPNQSEWWGQIAISYDELPGTWAEGKHLMFNVYDMVAVSREFQIMVNRSGADGAIGIQLSRIGAHDRGEGGSNWVWIDATGFPTAGYFDVFRVHVILNTSYDGSGILGSGHGNGTVELWMNGDVLYSNSTMNLRDDNYSWNMRRMLIATDCSWAGNNTNLYYDKIQLSSASDVLMAMPSAPVLHTTPSVVPVITVDPSNATVTEPATAQFSITATGEPAPTYQWQDDAGGWSNVSTGSGGTTDTYTTGATDAADTGILYRCVATNAHGSDTSASASLTINAVGSGTALWSYSFDSAQDQSNPEVNPGSAWLYASRAFTTSALGAVAWDGGHAIRSQFVPNESRQLDGGWWLDVYSEGQALLADARNWSVGIVCRMGSNYFDEYDLSQNKMFLVQTSSDGSSNDERPMVTPSPSIPAQTQINALIANDAAGNWYTETGLNTRDPDTPAAQFDWLLHQNEWLYLEMTHVYGGNLTLSIYSRDGVLALQNYISVPSVNIATADLFAINFPGYTQCASSANTTGAYMDTSDVYFGDTFMGPPTGFVT